MNDTVEVKRTEEEHLQAYMEDRYSLDADRRGKMRIILVVLGLIVAIIGLKVNLLSILIVISIIPIIIVHHKKTEDGPLIGIVKLQGISLTYFSLISLIGGLRIYFYVSSDMIYPIIFVALYIVNGLMIVLLFSKKIKKGYALMNKSSKLIGPFAMIGAFTGSFFAKNMSGDEGLYLLAGCFYVLAIITSLAFRDFYVQHLYKKLDQ